MNGAVWICRRSSRWKRGQQARCLQKGKRTALEERNVRHVFRRLLQTAALRHIRLHDLRHSCASLLLQQGESIVYVKEHLGHASIAITVETYGHLIPGANLAAVDRLDDVGTHLSATRGGFGRRR